MCYSKSNLKFAHEIIEPIASMSWSRRWSDISCVSSRHQHNEEEESEEDQGWPRCSRSDPNIGQVWIEPMDSMSWRPRWSELYHVPSRHHHCQEWRNKVQVQDEHLEEIICLKLAILMVIIDIWRRAQRRGSPIRVWGAICKSSTSKFMDMLRHAQRRVSPIGVWGSNLQVFNKQVQSRKSSILRWTRSSSSSSNGICSRQRYDLDRVYLLPVSWC